MPSQYQLKVKITGCGTCVFYCEDCGYCLASDRFGIPNKSTMDAQPEDCPFKTGKLTGTITIIEEDTEK